MFWKFYGGVVLKNISKLKSNKKLHWKRDQKKFLGHLVYLYVKTRLFWLVNSEMDAHKLLFWFSKLHRTSLKNMQCGAMSKWLRCWIPNAEAACSEILGSSKVDWAFHLSEVDQMSTMDSLELSSKM